MKCAAPQLIVLIVVLILQNKAGSESSKRFGRSSLIRQQMTFFASFVFFILDKTQFFVEKEKKIVHQGHIYLSRLQNRTNWI